MFFDAPEGMPGQKVQVVDIGGNFCFTGGCINRSTISSLCSVVTKFSVLFVFGVLKIIGNCPHNWLMDQHDLDAASHTQPENVQT